MFMSCLFFRMKTSAARVAWLVKLRQFGAELLGTATLIMFGCGSVAQAVLSRNKEA